MGTLSTNLMSNAHSEGDGEPDPIAIRLLKLQQRFDALDRLYNEEIGNLYQELCQLKADYIRLYQAQPQSQPQKNHRRDK